LRAGFLVLAVQEPPEAFELPAVLLLVGLPPG
jgi:hypothetical protein